MRYSLPYRKIIIEIVCLLYILLFVYAAASKLLDYSNFEVQLGQSPLLSPFAELLSWLVPLAELMLAVFLVLPKTRKNALWGSAALMMAFSFYIVMILKFSPYVPCSCGGVLEDMTWSQHLVFNIAFVLMAIPPLWYLQQARLEKQTVFRFALTCFGLLIITAAVNILCFVYTENKIVNDNPFIRRFPGHGAEYLSQRSLLFNSYYFAGSDSLYIYLGNYTAPYHMLRTDYQLKKIDTIAISQLKRYENVSLKVAVRYPDFYLYDGKVPIIFRGNISDWKVTEKIEDLPYFNQAWPVSSNEIAFRGNRSGTGATVIGLIARNQKVSTRLLDSLVVPLKDGDGVFDLDGTFLYDKHKEQLLYVHRYFNRIVSVGKSGNVLFRSKTIDTVSRPKTVVKKVRNNTTMKMATMPPYVNRNATTADGVLYVESALRGKYEDEISWKISSTIDAYDFRMQGQYLYSFYIPIHNGKRMRDFLVGNGKVIVLYEKELVCYELNKKLDAFQKK